MLCEFIKNITSIETVNICNYQSPKEILSGIYTTTYWLRIHNMERNLERVLNFKKKQRTASIILNADFSPGTSLLKQKIYNYDQAKKAIELET